jgi:hypothetical protein
MPIRGILFSASLLLMAPAGAQETAALYQCYSLVRVRGNLDQVDRAVDKISKIIMVGNRIHSVVDSQTAQVTFVGSVTGLKLEELKSMISDNSIKGFFRLTGQSLIESGALFLGCTEIPLKR